ncbi:hypothetical protein M1397_03870 [Candidatus Marsarchaeota archaeon]|jgi:hypothetical protein|nr:hypothetical protein [Candidatus Marsarchaeota archaeon]
MERETTAPPQPVSKHEVLQPFEHPLLRRFMAYLRGSDPQGFPRTSCELLYDGQLRYGIPDTDLLLDMGCRWRSTYGMPFTTASEPEFLALTPEVIKKLPYGAKLFTVSGETKVVGKDPIPLDADEEGCTLFGIWR